MTVKLLPEQHLEFLSLNGGCTGSSESTLVKCDIVGNHMSPVILLYRIISSTDLEPIITGADQNFYFLSF